MMRNRDCATRTRPIWTRFLIEAALLGLLLVLAAQQQAGAWGRSIPNWATMLDGAEVIAVGRVVGTPVYVSHGQPPDDGHSWEFHARLAIDEVLKGQCADHEIPIVLHYGLSPSEYAKDGKPVKSGHETNGALAIHDASGSGGAEPILDDARKPAVWLLAHYADRFGRGNKPTEDLGVREPEHMLPIAMLPFLRSVLKPEPIEKQLAFLHDPDARVRWAGVQYFTDRKETRAFPAVAGLLGDRERFVSETAVSACQLLGGQAAIPRLRPLLDGADNDRFSLAAYALAQLHDVGSTPKLAQMLATGTPPSQRWEAARALGWMRDPAGVPSLIGALKDDGLTDPGRGTEVWCAARDALDAVTWCRLSPNGDKAARWWQAANGLKAEAWHHFGMADTTAALPLMGPDELQQACSRWKGRGGSRTDTFLDAERFGDDNYSPARVQQRWRQWLVNQGWDAYPALPSQVDDEVAVSIEITAPLDSGQPVRLRYELTNKSGADLWLTKRYSEMLEARDADGNWRGPSGSTGTSQKPLTAADFRRLRPGETWTIVGESIIWNAPNSAQGAPPRLVTAALRFAHKGTSCGVDAWVGDVWAEPIILLL